MIPQMPKVALAIPYYKHWEGRFGLSALAMTMASARYCGLIGIECTGAYVEDNRNGAVKAVLELEKGIQQNSDPAFAFDYLLWMDTDMVFPPDALLRLINRDKDIVGANYRKRRPPYEFVGHYADGRDTHILEPGLHRMGHLGTGLLLVKMDIYRQMPYPWFDAGLIDVKPRDDVYFCRKAVEMGFEIWCDHDLTFEVRHIAEQEVPWFSPEQVIVKHGAEISTAAADAEGKANIADAAKNYRPELVGLAAD